VDVDRTADEFVVEVVVGVPVSPPEHPANNKVTTATATLSILIDSSPPNRALDLPTSRVSRGSTMSGPFYVARLVCMHAGAHPATSTP